MEKQKQKRYIDYLDAEINRLIILIPRLRKEHRFNDLNDATSQLKAYNQALSSYINIHK